MPIAAFLFKFRIPFGPEPPTIVRRPYLTFVVALALVISGLSCAAPQAAVAGSELSRLVPADAAICIEARGLDGHVRRFLNSEIYARITRYPPIQQWSAENGPALAQLSDDIQQNLGVPPAEVLTKIIGREALLAVWPPSADGARDGPALALVKTEDTPLLVRMIDVLCDAQQRAGKLRPTEKITAGDRTYTVRVIQPEPDQPDILLTVLGPYGVMTNSPQVLKQVVGLFAGDDDDPKSLDRLPAYRAGMARLNPDAAATLFVNPRPWDESIASEQIDEPLPVVWQQTQYLVASLGIGDRISAEGFLRMDAQALPDGVREITESLSGAARFPQHVPSDALVAVAGRCDIGRLVRLVLTRNAADDQQRPREEEMSPTTRGLLRGVGWFDDLMAGLGPDIGAYLVASPNKDETSLPFDLVIGVDTRPRWSGDMAPAVTDVLDHSLRTVFGMMVLIYNTTRGEALARLETKLAGGVRLTSISGVEELGGEGDVAYAFHDRLLLAGTSLRAVEEAVTVTPEESLAQSQRFSQIGNPRLENPSQVGYVDLAALRSLIDRHPGLLHLVQKDKGLDRDSALKSLDELISLLSLADAVMVEMKIDATGVAISANLTAHSDE